MLGRRIPQADMAQWLECVALDGGLKFKEQGAGGGEQENSIQVVLLHKKPKMSALDILSFFP